MNNAKNISFQGDTISAHFEYYNTNPDYSLEIIMIQPSCTCTGFTHTKPIKEGDKGIITIIFDKKSIKMLGILETVIKSNASNDYILLKIINDN